MGNGPCHGVYLGRSLTQDWQGCRPSLEARTSIAQRPCEAVTGSNFQESDLQVSLPVEPVS